MTDAQTARIAELEAELERLRGRIKEKCPFDLADDPRADIEQDEPCPVCGMLGTPDADDVCVGGSRRA